MGNLKTGKITVWTVLATTLTVALLVANSLNSVSAGNNNNNHNNHNNDHECQEDNNNHNNNRRNDDCDDDNDNGHNGNHNNNNHRTPSPSPRPTVRPTSTPTATPVATPSATPVITPTPVPADPGITVVHDGKGDGLGCAVNDCSGNKVERIEGFGVGGGGEVLGASTMAGAGSFDEMFYQAIMTIGATLSAFGIKGLRKAKKQLKK